MRSWSFSHLLLPTVFVGLLIPLDALAATGENAKILLHLTRKSNRVESAALYRTLGDPHSCIPCNSGESQFVVEGSVGEEYTMYILAADVDMIDGFGGASFGIEYSDGLVVTSWTSPANGQIKIDGKTGEVWPASGSGVILTFNQARDGIYTEGDENGMTTILLGVLDVYASGPAEFTFIGVPNGDRASEGPIPVTTVAYADGAYAATYLTHPDNVARAVFGTPQATAYDPCVSAASTQLVQDLAVGHPGEVTPMTMSNSFPNPSANGVKWSLWSNVGRRVDVSVYSVTGEVVNEWRVSLRPGETVLHWNQEDFRAQRVPRGVYYIKIASSDGYSTLRSVVVTN